MAEHTEITVKPGDTLSHIALRHLHDIARWPEIYALNEAVIREAQNKYEARRKLLHGRPSSPEWIYPGTVLKLPSTPNG